VHYPGGSFIRQVRQLASVRGASSLLVTLIIQGALHGCQSQSPTRPSHRTNHAPVIDTLIAFPYTIGPSDSTVVACTARDIDGDTLVYDWQTDDRLNIQGTPTWNKYLNNTYSPVHTFYNANLDTRISDSAWVYCEVRDKRGGGAGRHVFIILRRN